MMVAVRVVRTKIVTSAAVFVLSLLFLVLPAITAHAAVNIQTVKSDKGITAWLVEDHSLPIITIRFVFDGGSSQDPAGKEGLANLMTGLFDEGAGDLDSEAFQIRLDDAGAEMGFSESRDGIFGSMRMLSDHKDEAFFLLKLAVEQPRFDERPINRIRAQIVTNIIAGERDPDTIARHKWLKALYGDHPYGRPEQGTKESIATITADDLHAFHKAIFAKDGLHVAVVGDIDATELKVRLDAVFGGLPEKQILTPVADISPRLGQQLHVAYDLPQTSLQLAYPGVKRAAPEFYAAALMNEILGGGTFTSHLFKQVREMRGLAYSVSSGLVDRVHSSMLFIATATRSDRARKTLDVVRDTVRQMVEKGPTEAELAATKTYMIGAYAINNLDSSGSIAATLLELQLDRLGIDYIDRREALINAVTLDEINSVAKKLLSVAPAILIVGPALSENKTAEQDTKG